MPKMNFSRAFDLTLDDGEQVHFKAGMQNVPAEHAKHWFVKAMAEPDDDAPEEPEAGEKAKEPDAGTGDERNALLVMAEELGVKVDKRWNDEKIAAAIEAAEKAAGEKAKEPDAGTGGTE